MKNIVTYKSRISIYISTVVWALIILATSLLLLYNVEITDHFSHIILMQFANSISFCYCISIGCAAIIDITEKKIKNERR